MDWKDMAKRLEGLHTVDTISERLGVKRNTAINYVYELRKRGYIHEESRGSNGKRFYRIRARKKRDAGHPGLRGVINEHSPVKLASPYEERVHGQPITVEEAVVRAVSGGEFRVVLASLALFRYVEDWLEMARLAREAGVGRKIGALYDVARRSVPKVRRMDGRARRILKSCGDHGFIVDGIESDGYPRVAEEWRVKIPFSEADLEVYGKREAGAR